MCNFALMLGLLLAIEVQMNLTAIIIWVLAGLAVLGSILLIFLQQRTKKELKYELSQLYKMNENNVEFEFILKALQLATWHVNVESRTLVYDYDFRKKNTEWAALVDGSPMSEGTKLLVDEDAPRITKALEDICTGKTAEYHQEYRVKIPHTSSFYWEESTAIVAERDIDGHPLRLVGTSMRIDERKRMEEALVNARNQAEESNHLKSAFIANMSHEIRTPLNAIIGFTSLLPDVSGDEERKELIDLIQENNQKLLQIIDDVMNISKIESGDSVPVMSMVELNMTLTSVIDRLKVRIKKGVSLVTPFPKTEQYITTDVNHLMEMVKHLLLNALKFTEKGSVVVGYDQPVDKHIRIWVKDTGKGIPQDQFERIFERFYKIDEFVPGAGLGLPICRTMAQSLGGKITVESAPGEGACFTIEIPC